LKGAKLDVLPVLSIIGYPDPSAWQLRINGPAGQALEIQSSSDLSNWTPLLALTNSSGADSLSLPGPGLPQRFYRTRLLP